MLKSEVYKKHVSPLLKDLTEELNENFMTFPEGPEDLSYTIYVLEPYISGTTAVYLIVLERDRPTVNSPVYHAQYAISLRKEPEAAIAELRDWIIGKLAPRQIWLQTFFRTMADQGWECAVAARGKLMPPFLEAVRLYGRSEEWIGMDFIAAWYRPEYAIQAGMPMAIFLKELDMEYATMAVPAVLAGSLVGVQPNIFYSGRIATYWSTKRYPGESYAVLLVGYGKRPEAADSANLFCSALSVVPPIWEGAATVKDGYIDLEPNDFLELLATSWRNRNDNP